MNSLLWTLVGMGIFNTVVIFFDRFRTPVDVSSRVINAIYTLLLGLWALVLLVKGGQL